MIPNTSALLLNTSASNGNSNSENGRSAEPSLRSQAEIGFANLFGQRVSGAEHSGGSRNLPADRNSSGNRSDIMRATNDKQSARSAERNRAAERSAEERSRAANNDGRSRESADTRVRAPESELPKNELNRSEQSGKANKTDKNARSQNRLQTERAEDSRPSAEQSGEVQDARMEEAAASAEAVDAQTNAASEGGEEQAAQGEGDEAQEASGQEMLAALAAVPVQDGTELTAQEEIVVPQEEAAADALAAEKIAALADAAAKAVELPVAQAAALQADASMQKTDPGAPILAPGLLEESAEGQLSEKAALTLNLALEDGQAKGKGAQAGQAALLAQKGAQPQAAALASAQQAAQSANAKAAQTADSFASVLAAKGVAGNAAAGANAVSTTASTAGAGVSTAANSAAQAQHLNALTGSVPGQTSANGARAATVQQLPVYTPAGQKGWTDEMSVRLSWLAQRGESKAELVLSPPNMGKLGVSLHMNGDQMTAQFVAASAATRDMLEQAMPRLRELLQQANIELAQADVSTGDNPQQLFRGHAGEGEGSGAGHSRRSLSGGQAAGGDMTSTIATNTASSLAALMGDGAIDIFA